MKRERHRKARLAAVLAKFRIMIGALYELGHMLLRKQSMRLAVSEERDFAIGCFLWAGLDGAGYSGTLLEELTVNRLFEQIGEQKGILKILTEGNRAVSLDNYHWMIVQLLGD